jgi:hypothetical protein
MSQDPHADPYPQDIGCELKSLPQSELLSSAQTAIEINPSNGPDTGTFASLLTTMLTPMAIPEPWALAVVTAKYWGAKGVDLGVGWMDSPPQDLRNRILSHFNAWGKTANVRFREVALGNAQVRVNRGGSGYWSYLGTDILHIPRNQPTMNLQGFTMNTRDSEFFRVVRHEAGHTLGFPHEHMRREIIQLLDVQKTLAYFRQTQGWSEATVRSQVLTPLEERHIMATPQADVTSLMSYQLPGSITRNGQPIPGGNDISRLDAEFIAKLYPKADSPPDPTDPPPPPTGDQWTLTIRGRGEKPAVLIQ